MRLFSRILAIVGALVLVTAVSLAAVVSYYWIHDGTIEVRVRPKQAGGDDVSIRCPAFLARAGLALVPASRLRLGEEARSALSAAGEMVSELRRCPDATFVEVLSREESVRVSKRDGRLVIEADTPGETVSLAVPLATAEVALRAIRD